MLNIIKIIATASRQLEIMFTANAITEKYTIVLMNKEYCISYNSLKMKCYC